ncbi:MAG: NifB/NifX family molybdenum-iron cluster-binding protein, partial [Promethearchaeota archaeon]
NIPTEHFGLASAFLLADIDISSQTINTSQLVENPHKKAERKRGILGAKFLVNKGIDVLVIKDIGTFGVGPKAILTENNILLYQVWGETIQEILEGFLIYHSEAK